MRQFWRIWSYALGRKEGRSDREADAVALIRTLILLSYLVTNFFIIAGVIRHWNANTCKEYLNGQNPISQER